MKTLNEIYVEAVRGRSENLYDNVVVVGDYTVQFPKPFSTDQTTIIKPTGEVVNLWDIQSPENEDEVDFMMTQIIEAGGSVPAESTGFYTLVEEIWEILGLKAKHLAKMREESLARVGQMSDYYALKFFVQLRSLARPMLEPIYEDTPRSLLVRSITEGDYIMVCYIHGAFRWFHYEPMEPGMISAVKVEISGYRDSNDADKMLVERLEAANDPSLVNFLADYRQKMDEGWNPEIPFIEGGDGFGGRLHLVGDPYRCASIDGEAKGSWPDYCICHKPFERLFPREKDRAFPWSYSPQSNCQLKYAFWLDERQVAILCLVDGDKDRGWFITASYKSVPQKPEGSQGKFSKVFPRFSEGLQSLLSFCTSAAISIEHTCDGIEIVSKFGEEMDLETLVTMRLAANTANFRPTGNGVGWRGMRRMSSSGLEYETSRGVVFGWRVNSSDYQNMREVDPARGDNRWEFWVIHPEGSEMDPGSSLREGALEADWIES